MQIVASPTFSQPVLLDCYYHRASLIVASFENTYSLAPRLGTIKRTQNKDRTHDTSAKTSYHAPPLS